MMSRLVARWAVGLILTLLLLFGLDRVVVTQEELLELMLANLATAVSSEDEASLRGVLALDFSFSGPPPVRQGDHEETLRRFEQFWSEADSIVLSWREPSMTISGRVATLKVPGLIRFRSSDVLAVYRVDCEVTAVRLEDAWRLRRIDVLELRRGIL